MTDETADAMIDVSLPMDVILPAQFFMPPTAGSEPERRLRFAVLRDALRQLQRSLYATDAHGQRLHQEAAAWIASPDRDEPFSFENVCDALGLEADYIRGGLRSLRAVTLAGAEKQSSVGVSRRSARGRRRTLASRRSTPRAA